LQVCLFVVLSTLLWIRGTLFSFYKNNFIRTRGSFFLKI